MSLIIQYNLNAFKHWNYNSNDISLDSNIN